MKVCRKEWKKTQALYTSTWLDDEKKWISTEVREIQTGKEKLLCCEGSSALEQAAQRDCTLSILGSF